MGSVASSPQDSHPPMDTRGGVAAEHKEPETAPQSVAGRRLSAKALQLSPTSGKTADGEYPGNGPIMPFSRLDLESADLKKLREMIGRHAPWVKGNVGGPGHRSKQDIANDLAAALTTRCERPAAEFSDHISLPIMGNQRSVSGGIDAWVPTGNRDLYFAGMAEDRVLLRPPEACGEECFLTLRFHGRCRVGQTDMPTVAQLKRMETAVPASIGNHKGHTYHLVTAKVIENGQSYFQKKHAIKWYFVRSPSVGELREELDGIANFAALPNARKAASRLELLLSSTKQENIMRLDPDVFEAIDEPMGDGGESMHDGCGFMPDDTDLLQQLFGPSARHAVALQVRIIAPTIGVFKGMLVRKPGVSRIQLPASMRKVGRSLRHLPEGANSYATVVVLQFHPTKKNRELERRVGEASTVREERQVAQDTPISKMPKRLLSRKGVPNPALANNQSQHSFLVGVADPTGALPEGHVFVTGVASPGEVFVTRCPCVEPDDGRVFPVPTAQPVGMRPSHWDWLCHLPLGAIIFSTKGSQPLPLLCAGGDLDGDYYFVCWNSDIVRFSKDGKAASSTHGVPLKEEGDDRQEEVDESGENVSVGWLDHHLANFNAAAESSHELCRDTNAAREQAAVGKACWLVRVQNHLRDVRAIKQEYQAIGKLYKAWDKVEQQNGMGHPDALAYARAYKHSLEYGKHGGEIKLPDHLPDPRFKTAPPKPKAAATAPAHMEGTCLPTAKAKPDRLHQELLSQNVKELRLLIDKEELPVSKGLGGKGKRQKQDMVNDIVDALLQKRTGNV